MSDLIHNGRFRWVVLAFMIAGLVMTALLGWQLSETSPAKWCVIASQGTLEFTNGCLTILMKLLDIKQHVVIGLLVVVGISVLSLAAVALGVRIGLQGPGGLSANIDSESVTVTDNATGSTVAVPTPPAEEIK